MSAEVLRFPDGQPIVLRAPLVLPLIVSARVVHQKFGVGTVTDVDGNKLTVDFDHAGQKRVVDSFVRAVAGRR